MFNFTKVAGKLAKIVSFFVSVGQKMLCVDSSFDFIKDSINYTDCQFYYLCALKNGNNLTNMTKADHFEND